MRIAIVGAGLAGLAAAVAASAAGAAVEVFDAQPSLAAPQAHIDVVPTLLRELVTLGVGDACVQRGFAYRGIAVVTANGRPAFEIPTPTLAGAVWPAALGMVYGDLLHVLHDTALRQGARLRWAVTLERLAQAGGTTELGTAAGRCWQGDLVLVAGARGMRGLGLPLADSFETYPQRWDHVLLPRPSGLDRSTWILGPGLAKALLVPVGVARAGIAVLRPLESDRSAAALRACLGPLEPVLRGAAAHLDDATPVFCRPVRSGLLAGAWQDGAVLRIGSSAHLLPPHFGQAAAQSIEDATVLRELLLAGLPRDALLRQFAQRRTTRAAQVHALATQAARWDLHPEPATDLPALARQLAAVVAQPA